MFSNFVQGVNVLTQFGRHLNVSTPFSLNEYNAIYKRPNYAPWGFDEYADFRVAHSSTYSLLGFSLHVSR